MKTAGEEALGMEAKSKEFVEKGAGLREGVTSAERGCVEDQPQRVKKRARNEPLWPPVNHRFFARVSSRLFVSPIKADVKFFVEQSCQPIKIVSRLLGIETLN